MFFFVIRGHTNPRKTDITMAMVVMVGMAGMVGMERTFGPNIYSV